MKQDKGLVWRGIGGQPVSCSEKLKVLDQNLAEFEAMARDMLEDSALMGCDVEQVRAVLRERIDAIAVQYAAACLK